jgi:hypothetical protein
MQFEYDDFSDVRTGQPYGFSAKVLQGFVTISY